ncbi:MAG: FAD-dependent oxidoreductase [Bacteroidota bacterium]
MKNEQLPVAIIGGGPVGLAAAAHLLDRGEEPIVFEAGPEPAYAIKQWQHVRLFSPWEFNVDQAAAQLLEEHGWSAPDPEKLPTGREFREHYLLPLAQLPELKSRIRLESKVTAVSRKHWDKVKDSHRQEEPYLLTIQQSDGSEYITEAKAVMDSSGTWFNPNPVGSSGIPAPGERKYQQYIQYGIPDVLDEYRERYLGREVAVVGSGHSAMQVVLDLIKLQDVDPDTRVHWIMRSQNLAKVFGGGENDQLEARGELGSRAQRAVQAGRVVIHTPFLLQRIQSSESSLRELTVIGDTEQGEQRIRVDRIVGTTGFRPDLQMIREVRTSIDPAIEAVADLAPLIDPNVHSCGTVPPHGVNELKHPDENFFLAGIKSYGRAPNFLLATGYEQVRSIAAYLTGDQEAAERIELHLPETGVCSSDFILDSDAGACCSTSVTTDDKKETASGCCSPQTEDSGCCGPVAESETLNTETGCC